MKGKSLLKPALLISIFLFFLFTITPVISSYAHPLPPKAATAKVKARAAKIATHSNNRANNKKAATETSKLRACRVKEAAVIKRSNNLARRAELIFSRFHRIFDRVDEYYNDKLVPQGAILENYESLKANVEQKQQGIVDALENAKDAVAEIDCESDNAKAQIAAFRGEMQNVIRAINEYKKSVINFLVAVRTKGKNIKTATGSATPSATSSAE